MKSGVCVLLLAAIIPAAAEPLLKLPAYTVEAPRVALQEPAGTFAMPVTALRYEPLADVQARNLAEAQADVTIRGGIFENTGFRIGGAALYDPQTGHYFAELPVPPAMLSAPRILTGTGNALGGFNANVGTVAYDWQRIRARGELTAAAGQCDSVRGSVYVGVVGDRPVAGLALGADAEVSQSVSDGSVPFGDHRFARDAVRLQLAGRSSQTDLFASYQEKFFGWPNLYTPFGSAETENLQTVLVMLNHRTSWGAGDWIEACAFWRRNRDNYTFNRFAPVGPVPPFWHTTWTSGAAFSGHDDLGAWAFGFDAEVLADDLKSTSLVYGRFHSRTYVKLGLTPEKTWTLAARRHLAVKAGATYDDTNRDAAALSPLVEIALTETRPAGGTRRLYCSYAQTTQVPTYTALNSSATAGLFRGNPHLGRSTSRNLELGGDETRGSWQAHAAVFYRRDDRLVDWTFQQGVTARTANAVNIDTVGAEAVVKWSGPRGEFILGYTVLHKRADYGRATVTASFYALNFPKQRLTAALVARLGGGFELRMDNQARVQADNPLRTIGGDRAVISSLGLFYRPPRAPNLELSLQVDNLWDSDFQAMPAVPAARREMSGGLACRW
jgi:hypothetical protein